MLRVIRNFSLLHYSLALVLVVGALAWLWPGAAQYLFVAALGAAFVLLLFAPKLLALVRAAQRADEQRTQLAAAHAELSALKAQAQPDSKPQPDLDTHTELKTHPLANLSHEPDNDAVASTAAALRETNQTLQAIIQASPLAIVVLDVEGRVKLWNASAERIYGWPAEEVLNEPLPTIPAGQEAELQRNQQAAVAGRSFVNYETRRRRKDGALFDVSISTAPLHDAAGQTYGVVALVADITERKRNEQSLRRSEARNQALLNAIPDLIFQFNRAGLILDVHATRPGELFVPPAEFLGKHVADVMPPHIAQETLHYIERACASGTLQNYEYELAVRGETHFYEARVVASGDDEVIVIVRNVTTRRRAQQALKASEERYRAFVEQSFEAIWRAELEQPLPINMPEAEQLEHIYRYCVVGECNDAMARMYGYTHAAELIGKRFEELLPRTETNLAFLRAIITSGYRLIDAESQEVDKDGRTLYFLNNLVGIVEDERLLRVWGTQRDVTARRRTETAEHFLADATAVLASSLDYELTLDRVARLAVPYLADWCMVYMADDSEAIRLLAVAHEDEAKVALAREIEEADAAVPRAIRTGLAELYPYLSDPLHETPTYGVKRQELARQLGLRSAMVVPLAARGRTIGALSFALAESDRRYNKDDLVLAEELARRAALAIDNARLYRGAQEANRAKDEFLATLSHELRTPLTPIIGWVHMLNNGQMLEADIKHGLNVIDKNSQSLARLINDLLDMSAILNGKMRIDRLPVTIENVLREAVETVRPEAAHRQIEIEFTPCGETGPVAVSGDRTRLGQVFWNLITNAVKFSGTGGRVRVRCVTGDTQVRVYVEDDGIGITPDFLPHVFERFWQADMSTTKTHGGLGIGLALVKSFIEAHGGTVTAASAGHGLGSSFTVSLPRLSLAWRAPEPAQRAPAGPAAQSPLQSPHLLLVEDAEDTLELLRRAFVARGYRVTACLDAQAALRVAERVRFDIIVSDIGLPHTDGYELLEQLRRGHPAVLAVALTGYAAVQDVARARAAGFAAHVAKPVDPATLARVVEQLLAERAAAADEA